MKTFRNKKTTNNLIITILVITILSALVPIHVQAKTDTENGGLLLTPIEDFVLFVCDEVMNWLQHTFVSLEDIEVDEGVWDFKYSPAIIFSGTVPAMDINFITPNTNKINMETNNYKPYLIKKENEYYKASTEIKGDIDNIYIEEVKKLEGYKVVKGKHRPNILKLDLLTYDYEIYYLEENNTLKVKAIFKGYHGDFHGGHPVLRIYEPPPEPLTEEFLEEVNEAAVYESIAAQLQGTIATWYTALRRIALVGLLSVLVYIGIRMVLSSSSQDKAKYKAMMKDWVVAICLLFTLHYIMSITMTVTDEISDIFESGDSDELLNTLRGEIYNNTDRGIIVAKTIMYTVLTILTVGFTVQYLKRVIFMAFYTLIAPLITLTYPLDKIKDGQAQAFTMWIREYVYTALLQVIHLIIYTVLVGTALDLVSHYPLYAIITLLFIKKADGIIKKMFGFENSDTVGTLGAAATGALIVNALNQIARKRRG